MIPVIPADIEALALADAAGALGPGEHLELQARLTALSPDARAHVARLYDAAQILAGAADERPPSPEVRTRVLASLEAPTIYTLAAEEGEWIDPGLPGIRLKILAMDRQRGLMTMHIKAEPGAKYPGHRHSAPEECLVLRGTLLIGGRLHRPGDFHHADADSDHGEISTVEGAEVLVVGGIEDYMPGGADA